MVTCPHCGVASPPAVDAAHPSPCPRCGRALPAAPQPVEAAGAAAGADPVRDTAERPAVPLDHTAVRELRTAPAQPPLGPPPTWRPDAAPPPAPTAAPAPARYPLYADTGSPPWPRAVPPVTPPPADPAAPPRRRRRRLVGLVAAGVVLVLLAGGVVLMVVGGPDDAVDEAAADTTPDEPGTGPTQGREPRGRSEPSDPPSDRGDGGDRGDRGGQRDRDRDRDAGPPAELATTAAITVPGTARPTQDVAGDPVDFEAANLTDGDPTTCWRVGGDRTDGVLVIDFDRPVRLTEVGLVNGYAKTSGRYDWYRGNRRVLRVEWVLDDGTTLVQRLDQTRQLQRLDVDDVRTSGVRLRLLRVSDPGDGPSSRDYTAISELSLVGTSVG